MQVVGGDSGRQLREIDGVHDGLVCPTEEERATLRRVADAMPLNAYWIAVVEVAERFSVRWFSHRPNFIQHPLPVGSHTGAGLQDGQSGALGKGQHASTRITASYQFGAASLLSWARIYYIADLYLSRFNTICVGVAIGLVGHFVHSDTALSCVHECIQGFLDSRARSGTTKRQEG
ncbi:hypothetical protein C8R46DRAFT_910571 [Mycena filopes]|nr:hypothetical protein C8R46DRAFT_910571 [Mycena filopes]